MKTDLTAKDIKAMLARKYAPPEFAFFTEVGSSTGSASRWADGIAYSLYASTGFEIHGFEIKVSRSDFLHEMQHPGKAEEIKRHCDRWWLVTPAKLVSKDELPKDWGLIEISGTVIRKTKLAPLLEGAVIDKAFIAALVRRATEGVVPRHLLAEMNAKSTEAARVEIAKEFQGKIDRAESDLKRYQERVTAFEGASGVNVIGGWERPERVGEAVRFVLDGGLNGIARQLDGAVDDTERALSELRRARVGVQSIKAEKPEAP